MLTCWNHSSEKLQPFSSKWITTFCLNSLCTNFGAVSWNSDFITVNSQSQAFPDQWRCFCLCLTSWSSCFYNCLKGSGPSIRKVPVPFVKIKMVGMHSADYLYVLSWRSKKLQIRPNLGCLFSLTWKEREWNDIFTRVRLIVSVCMRGSNSL